MTYTANPHPLKVKADNGHHLLTYDPASRAIKIVERGIVYEIPLWLIEEHLRTSQRDILTIYGEVPENLPCGHTEGTVMNAYMDRVCAVCGQ